MAASTANPNDLRSDPGKTNNVIAEHPCEAERLKARLKSIVDASRSRP